MDDKKKILLGEKNILSKDNEDLFININLGKTFSEIRDDKYENIFDVEKQFNKERNASRDFRVYGIIDSTIVDCDNLVLYAYDSSYYGTGINSGVTFLSGLVTTLSSTTLVYNGLNAYNKKRGKYLIELTGYTHDILYIKIPSNNLNYSDQIYVQQLIFRDSENNFINYGTQTIDVDVNGNAIEINNDFYFLYNKHWVKKDLLIKEEKPTEVSFNSSLLTNIISETPIFSTATTFSPFSVILNKPSPFGLEQVDLSVLTSTLDPTNEIVVTDANFVLLSLPHTINFSSGEQIKNFYFLSPQDVLQEFTEDVIFELNNFNFVNTGSTLTTTFFITDATSRNRVVLNLQNIYQNRNYFNGQVTNFSSTNFSTPMPAVLRNGLMFEGSPMEFYPIDNFNLKIKNEGVSTVFPVNATLGIFAEQDFASGQELQFNNINATYENIEKNSINLYFNTRTFSNTQGVSYGAFLSGFTINDIPIVDYWLGVSYKFDYDTIVSCLKKMPVPSTNQVIGGWNRYNLETPFDVIENQSALTITLVAKSPGTRLDIKPYGFSGDIYDLNGALAIYTFSAQSVQEFIYSAQTPLEITLAANVNGNSQAKYTLEFSKTGFETMPFTITPLNAAVIPPVYYLASGYNTILRNWNDNLNKVVYVHSGVTSNLGNSAQYPNGRFGLYNTGEVYINGVAFLSNLYFDNTINTSSFLPGGNSINVSHSVNAANNFSRDFLSSPISIIPVTSEFYSPQNSAQIGFLGIRPGTSSYISDPNINLTRSFNFRTGTTGNFNTYYFNNYLTSRAQWEWTSYNDFFSSGGTVGTNETALPSLSLRHYLQDGNSSYGITDQGLSGVVSPVITNSEALEINSVRGHGLLFGASDFIKLTARTSGVPFEFNNFIEMRYLSGPNNGTDFSNDTMCYVETQPNEILGVTINKANNHMGGYSLNRPSTPILPSLLKVSFELAAYTNSSGQLTVKVSLDAASTTGVETAEISKLLASNAILGVHYTENQSLPITLSWAIGEMDKFLVFSNINQNFNGTKILKLKISNIVNLDPGLNMNSDIILL